ncbi:hypothetical protein [Glutamicibacter sp.]|uniref:hypothetical protein n=1 Tax=Glutamicibacter sp. TaxID=1931995 RepID=UPI002B473DF1|nr:hypothetical protein [Glutamicibacter sp.]HJX78510.1 hypothetical protein [Glutamicibacter sp.]
MTSRIIKTSIFAALLLSLSACSAEASSNGPERTTVGVIELAVTHVCARESDSKCISLDGEQLVLPSTFERAVVDDATVAAEQGPNTVNVIFSDAGTKIFREVTEEAAKAGESARLLIKVDGEIEAAVVVMETIEDGHTLLDFTPKTAQEVIELIGRS